MSPRKKKKDRFDAVKEVKKLARERVGRVPAEKLIPDKSERKPKHKKRVEEEGAVEF